MGNRLLPHKAHFVGGIHIQRGSIDAECEALCICVCLCMYLRQKRKPLQVVSLSLSPPLPYFVLDVEGSVISSHLAKLNLFLHCFNDLDLFIEHFFSLSLVVLCFFRDLICCLLQSVFGPLHNLSGIGVREDEKDRERERTDRKRAMRGTVGSTSRTLLKQVCHFDFLSIFLIIQYYHDMALYLTTMARVK